MHIRLMVGKCRSTLANPTLKAPVSKHLKLKHYQLLSSFAFNFNLRRYIMVTRGLKPTPYQNPNITLGKPTIVVAAEFKAASRVEPAR